MIGLAATAAACSGGISEMTTAEVKDAAGMTQDEVEQLGPEGRFNLTGERYQRMQELMTEAQLQVSNDEWGWGGGGFMPNSGSTAYAPLPGATLNNSHYMDMTRIIHPEGAVGAVADARPVFDYFVSKGWEVALTENDFSELELEATHDFRVQAITEDGYRVQYVLQQNGQYYFDVLTDTFWGDADTIMNDQIDRFGDDPLFPQNLPETLSTEPGQSVPGVYTEYPKWEDPILQKSEG